jgi:hypothetical protein
MAAFPIDHSFVEFCIYLLSALSLSAWPGTKAEDKMVFPLSGLQSTVGKQARTITHADEANN